MSKAICPDCGEEGVLCPHCGKVNDAYTQVGPDATASPREGDISMCFTCAGVAIFTGEGLEVRLPDEEESAEIETDRRIIVARAAIKATKE